jgi:membrane-bound lytic murein transglycosylase D
LAEGAGPMLRAVTLLLIFVSVIAFGVVSTADAKLSARQFPVSSSMRIRVNFWKKVYTEIDSQHAFLHDNRDPAVIYKTIKLPKGRRRTVQRFVEREKLKVRRELNSIINKKRKERSLSKGENKLYRKIGRPSVSELRRLRSRIRMQRGLKNRYKKGLSESFRYIKWIKSTFLEMDLPQALAYLPHVESSFNYRAYSKVGAAGIWQFMRGTARRYKLKIDYIRDERRDPLKATKAAAKLLRDNYRIFKSWPLAVSAYNFGPASIKRAMRKVGSSDLSYIIRHYKGRRFGFASKNFYATFIATAELSENYQRYFPNLKKAPVFKSSTLTLNRRFTPSRIASLTGIKQSQLKEYNKVLRPAVFKRQLSIPRRFKLKIPAFSKKRVAALQKALNSSYPTARSLVSGGEHRVRRGESLYTIAKSYNTTMSSLISFNQVENPSMIHVGTVLQIPRRNNSATKVAKKVTKKPKSRPKPLPKPAKNKRLSTMLKKSDDNFFNSYQLSMQKISRDRYEVVVEVDETLGHFADWARVSGQQIRNKNSLGQGSTIYYGQKLIIPIGKQRLLSFNIARIEYHQSIEEDFYESYSVEGERSYLVQKGDTFAEIVQREEVPLWLIKKRWPKGEPFRLIAGKKVTIPIISSKQ